MLEKALWRKNSHNTNTKVILSSMQSIGTAILRLFRSFVRGHHGLGDLVAHLVETARRRSRQHHRLRILRRGEITHGVEILVEQHHIVHVVHVHADCLQTLDLVDDTIGDLTTIVGLAFTLKTGLLSLGCRLGLDLNTLGFGALTGGLLLALGKDYVRFSLLKSEDQLREAVRRVAAVLA